MPALDHPEHEPPGQLNHRAHVDRDHLLQLRELGVLETGAITKPSVVDEHVDPTLFDQTVAQGVDRLGVGQVARHDVDLEPDAYAKQLVRQRLEPLGASRDENDATSLDADPACKCTPDSRRGSRNEHRARQGRSLCHD